MREPTGVIDPDDPAYAGQATYTPTMLRVYDLAVVQLSNRLVWRCPPDRMVDLYERHVGRAHVDAGPGTGFYLDRARLPRLEELTLVDANPRVLAHAGQRLERFTPRLLERNLLAAPSDDDATADSGALNFVLHCLPGPMAGKAAAIRSVAALVRPGGTVFGSTILDEGHHVVGRRLQTVYRRQGIFGNEGDTRDGLRTMLATELDDVVVEVEGTVALFAGRRRADG